MRASNQLSTRQKIGNTIGPLLIAFCLGAPALTVAEETASVPEESSTPATTSPESNKPSGSVARAIFTTAIVDREPVDNLTTISNSVSHIYFFSDLRGLAGQIVTHRWQYNGQVMAEVTFKVGNGARWRVYSSKNLLPEWTGTWTVVVSDEKNQPLQTSTFEYTAEPVSDNLADTAPATTP